MKLFNHNLAFWLVIALVICLFYLAVSAWGYSSWGFPLDDAWIHQTYARNLARSGELAFVPGVASAGSTAPLWSFLLSIGYLVGAPHQIWAYGLGVVFLALTGWTVARLGRRLFPESRGVGFWAGLFCVLEWHLVWAAVSGMETILFVWLSTFLIERYLTLVIPTTEAGAKPVQALSYFGLGLGGGLLILVRPEGLGLVGLVGLDMAYRWWRQSQRQSISDLWQRWLLVAVGVGILLGPYVIFHLGATGLPFPNTFYAKQAEYGVILETYPWWWRFFGNIGPSVETVQGVFRVIFIGPQILLLPGLCFAVWLTYKERRTELTLIWIWWMGYLVLYALRLPVTYQHGRYQIPAIPWVILLGVWGTARLLSLEPITVQMKWSMVSRIVRRAVVLSVAVLVLAFAILGAQAYGRDVRFIESEMVATAKWLHEYTEPDVLIAAHDIGAIGYFAQRPLIDLAGLVTPEIIPIIRDEAAIFAFMAAEEADYLVTFPSWYPNLTQNPTLVLRYTTDAPWTLQMGGDNMAVYDVVLRDSPKE